MLVEEKNMGQASSYLGYFLDNIVEKMMIVELVVGI
jgi:hypothetical protein